MIARSIAIGSLLLLAACSRETDHPASATQSAEVPVAGDAKTAASPVPAVTTPAPAPTGRYYDKADEFSEPFHPDLTIGLCLAFTGGTQSKLGNRGAGISPFTALNNYLASVGLDLVDVESGDFRVIRLPSHGKLGRGTVVEYSAYEPDPDYLGDDRLVLAAEVGGKKYELRYYLHTIENYYGLTSQEPCRQSSWKIGPGPPYRFEPPKLEGMSDAFQLGACRLVYTNDTKGMPIRNGLSAPLTVMARQQALLREWNDDQWKVRVVAQPEHGTLKPDTSLEGSFFYLIEPGFVGFDRITFEVSLGPETYHVEQIVLVNSLDPGFEEHVPPELQNCEALKLPGLPSAERNEG